MLVKDHEVGGAWEHGCACAQLLANQGRFRYVLGAARTVLQKLLVVSKGLVLSGVRIRLKEVERGKGDDWYWAN